MKKYMEKANIHLFSDYKADMRIEEKYTTFMMLRNGELTQSYRLPEKGAFIRVEKDGLYRYGATTDLDDMGNLLNKMAGIKNKEKNKDQGPKKVMEFVERLNISQDFIGDISLDKLYKMLADIYEGVKDFPGLKDLMLIFKSERIEKYFGDYKGRNTHYNTNHAGIIAAFTLGDGDNIFRSNFDKNGKKIGDFENFKDELLEDLKKAALFLDAKTVKPGVYPVVLSELVTGVFAHESFGHKSESDFMVGDPAMKEEWKIGQKVGSPILSIVDQGDITESTGFVPFDDEGFEKKKTYLVKDGILSGRLHSSSTAQYLEEENTGNARAAGFLYEPIVRMTTTFVDKGDQSFKQLISPIKLGYYIEKPSHGSGMSTFTIAVNRAWEIVDGEIGEPVKINVITGSIFETLFKIDGISDKVKLFSLVGGGCGKMEQFPLAVGLGGPKVRVSEMTVS